MGQPAGEHFFESFSTDASARRARETTRASETHRGDAAERGEDDGAGRHRALACEDADILRLSRTRGREATRADASRL